MAEKIPTKLKQRLGLLAIASFLLALSGLYGTYQEPFFLRWLYWALMVGFGIWISDALSRQLMPLLASLPWVGRWLIFSTVLTLPLFGFVAALQGLGGEPIPPEFYVSAGFKVWMVTAVITAFGMRDTDTTSEIAVDDPVTPSSQSAAEPVEIARPTLLERAKPELRQAELLAITAEDHYVRLITDAGDDMVLMRFADAIAEASELDGLQVHRSWWIAAAAVARVDKSSDGSKVTLTNGIVAPISRRRVAEVEKAGWLQTPRAASA